MELKATRRRLRGYFEKLGFIGSRWIVNSSAGLRLIANNAFQSVVELARARAFVSGISATVSAAEFRSYWNFSSRNRFSSALRSRHHRRKKGKERGAVGRGWARWKKKKKIDTSDFRRYCARCSAQSLSGQSPLPPLPPPQVGSNGCWLWSAWKWKYLYLPLLFTGKREVSR